MTSAKKTDLLTHPAGTALVPDFHRRFHREPVTGSAAFRYMSATQPHLLYDQVSERGLSFGDLAVDGGVPMEVTFESPLHDDAVTEIAEGAIRKTFQESGLDPYLLYTRGPEPGMLRSRLLAVTIHEDIHRALSADRKEWIAEHIAPGHRLLIELGRFGSFPYRMRATCQEAADAAFAAAQALGLRTTPAHFSAMGALALDQFVDHAIVWHDTAHDKWFGEILWQPAFGKSRSWYGGTRQHVHEPMGPSRELWSFAGRDRPRIRINCLPVEPYEIDSPTPAMFALHARSLTESHFW